MKNLVLAISAMILFLVASTASAADLKPATAAATLGQVEDILNRQLVIVDARLRDLKAQMAWKANANQVPTAAEFNAVRQAVDDRVAVDRLIKGRLNSLKMAVKANRSDIESLIKAAKELRGVSVDTIKALNALTFEVEAVKAEVKAQGERLTGVEGRQNATDSKVATLEGKVAEVTSRLWASEFAFGLFTEKGFAMAGSGFNARFGMRNASGNGWFTSLSLGAGDLLAAPRPTSVVVRAGGQFALGGQRSALTIDAGALAGAAGTSLTVNPGFVVGGTVGLTLRPRAWYGLGLGVGGDLVTGHYTGVNAFVSISFSPLGELQIGE